MSPLSDVSFAETIPAADPVGQPPAYGRLISYLKTHWKAPEHLAQTIVETAHTQSEVTGIPATLILAIIAKESSFRPGVKSGYGAQGLMQVVPRWHPEKLEERKRDALLDPVQNIEVGAQVLSEYVGRAKGDTRRALAKYSGGAQSYYEKVRGYQSTFEQVANTGPESL